MRIFKIIILILLFSFNCFANEGDIKIKDVNLIVNNDSTVILKVDKAKRSNTVRRIDIIELLPNCSEYCLNLSSKSELIINDKYYLAKIKKHKGKYIIRVTIEEINNKGVKISYFEEKYFEIT